MKIFVIGGTGLVGSYLLPMLVKESNDVYALTRNSDKVERINKLGAYGIIGDIRDIETFRKDLPKNLDIIVLLAMPSVKPGKKITRKRKEELKNETNDFFINSMDLAKEFNIPVILPSGTSFKTKNDEIADETWPILRIGLTEIGKDTDEMVNNAIRNNDPKVIQLIYGKIYGNGGLFRFIYDMMDKGRSKILGNGENYIPNIHAKDAASAIIMAIEKLPVGEKFIIADDTPVSQKEFMTYMAELMDKKRPGRIPGFLVKIAIGKDFYEIIRMNCKVSNAKAKKMLDWHPAYPSYKEGLQMTINEMKEKKNYFA